MCPCQRSSWEPAPRVAKFHCLVESTAGRIQVCNWLLTVPGFLDLMTLRLTSSCRSPLPTADTTFYISETASCSHHSALALMFSTDSSLSSSCLAVPWTTHHSPESLCTWLWMALCSLQSFRYAAFPLVWILRTWSLVSATESLFAVRWLVATVSSFEVVMLSTQRLGPLAAACFDHFQLRECQV